MTTDQERVVWALDVGKRTHRPVLEGVNLEVQAGRTLLVRADSGAGKTTLLSLLGGLKQPDQGQVLILGKNLARLSHRKMAALRRRMGFVFQDLRLCWDRSVLYNVLLPLRMNGAWGKAARTKVEEACRLVGLEPRDGLAVADLSRGEQQLVALARAIVAEPFLILADEPTAHLDTRTSLRVMGLLRRMASRGAAVVVATADMMASGAFDADAEFELQQGRLIPRWGESGSVAPLAAAGA